jgi:short-subunit dehydrogenase
VTTHVVITGASSGLGAALAGQFAGTGCALSLFGRDVGRLSAVADACRPTAGTVETFNLDVTDTAAMAAALREIDARLPIDILIANAGLGGSEVLAPPTGEPPELARRIAEVNLIGVLNTVAPLTAAMTSRGRGHVVIIGSMAGGQGLAESPVYSASKAAVRVYGEGLRRLLAPRGVRVTVVVPGFITTPMSQSLPMRRPFEWTVERAAARIIGGIERNEAEIIFPWQLRSTGRVIGWLPRRLRDRAMILGRYWTGRRP